MSSILNETHQIRLCTWNNAPSYKHIRSYVTWSKKKLHYTHHGSKLYLYVTSVCSIVARGNLFLMLCLTFSVYLLKGYLENTEKDRIKRLIRLKPPTEFWMRSSEPVIIQSAVWLVCRASCNWEWQGTVVSPGYLRFTTTVIQASLWIWTFFLSLV